MNSGDRENEKADVLPIFGTGSLAVNVK